MIRVPRWVLLGYVGTAMYFPFILVANDAQDPERTFNHEKIHRRQIIECLIIPFYVLYVLFYVKGLIKFGKPSKAYHSIPFEVEAYKHDDDFGYLSKRKLYAWLSN